MDAYEKKLEEYVERSIAKHAYSLKELIYSEELYAYHVGYLSILSGDELSTAIVPCNGYMILTRDRYNKSQHKNVAEYAIYKLTDKNTFGEDTSDYDKNVFNAETSYELYHISDLQFDNMALAICNATEWIYKLTDGKE